MFPTCRNFTGNNCQIEPFCSSRTVNPLTTKCSCEPGWNGPTCDEALNKFTVTLPAGAPQQSQEFSGPYRASSEYGTDNTLFTLVTGDHANQTYTVRKAADGWEMVRAARQCTPLPQTTCEGHDLHSFGPPLHTPTAEMCREKCLGEPADEMCKAWTWNGTVVADGNPTCVLKSDCPETNSSTWATSGRCAPPVVEVVFYNPVSSALPPQSGWVHDNMDAQHNQVPTISYQ